MKQFRFTFLLLAMIAVFLGCGSGKPDFSSPEATFQTMVDAIKAKDFEVYSQCWHSQRAMEGLVPIMQQKPELWDELGAMVAGNVSLQAEGDTEERHGPGKKFKVISPDVPEGKRLGTISLIKEGDMWKMYHW